MKIKVSISNYGSHQTEYLYRNVETFRSFENHQVDLRIYSTVPLSVQEDVDDRFTCRVSMVDEGIAKGLPFVCRENMIAEADKHDLFIYNENDMLITEDNIEAFLEHSGTLSSGQVSGFIRYEINEKGEKILLDPNPHWGRVAHNKTQTSFQLRNLHQGCWVLLNKDFKHAISSGGMVYGMHSGPYGPLEQGASDPYTQCGLTKVFPTNYELCQRLMIHHMPNKYVKYHEWQNSGIRLDQLFQFHLN